MDFFNNYDEFYDDIDADEFNGHIKGKRCDQCGSEAIFYDGEQFECDNCGMIWPDIEDIGTYIPDDFEIHENMMKDIRESEKQMFRHSITKSNLKSLFSPLSNFFKKQELLFEHKTDPKLHYEYMLTQAISESFLYSVVKNVEAPKEINSKIIEDTFNSFMRNYMSAIDELPYNATPEVWAKYLKTDIEEVSKFFPKNGLNIDDYIAPWWVIDNFSIIFSNKINSIDRDVYDMCGIINMDSCFSMYLLNNDKSFGFIMKRFLSEETKIAERYINGYKLKKDEFLSDAKKNNLSVLETVMQFVYYAFEESYIKL